jgi:Inhibitor of growth proteins N-terminal histone-binding
MSYLEEFESSINYLPGEVCRSLELIRLLDEKAKSCTDDFTNLSLDYFATLKKEQGVVTENSDLLQNIRTKQSKAISLSKEKVSISKQLLGMIEYHINKLKLDLDTYKREISVETEKAEEKISKKPKIERDLGLSLDTELSMYMENPDMQDGYDMQGDENKTYCYCNKGSFGEMIECEGHKVTYI